MTALFVAPDTEYVKQWEALGFSTDWDAPDEVVMAAAKLVIKEYLPKACEKFGWDVDYSVKPQIRPHPFPGDSGENVTRQNLGLAPISAAERMVRDGLKDWVVLVLCRQKARVTLKYQPVYGPREGFALREECPPELQTGIGSVTPEVYINGH